MNQPSTAPFLFYSTCRNANTARMELNSSARILRKVDTKSSFLYDAPVQDAGAGAAALSAKDAPSPAGEPAQAGVDSLAALEGKRSVRRDGWNANTGEPGSV